jgi:hypothetical protein
MTHDGIRSYSTEFSSLDEKILHPNRGSVKTMSYMFHCFYFTLQVKQQSTLILRKSDPRTLAHELSHPTGHYREEEANFIALPQVFHQI